MNGIFFTKHAEEKFAILARYKFMVSRHQVVDAVTNPEVLDRVSRHPLIIAEKIIDHKHVLRVVYKVEEGIRVIITFYPGRKKQYEKKRTKNK